MSFSRSASVLALLFCFCVTAASQTELVQLKITAVLIDKDLNLKPVPKLALVFEPLSGVLVGQKVTVKTGFDGVAEVELAPGRYQLSTPDPVEFQGKRYAWRLEVGVSGTGETLELSNDNAQVEEAASAPAVADSLDPVALFQRYQNSVATVWSEFGHGTGFFVDDKGLLLTNQHVIGPAEYISVQFDASRKVRALLLEADPEKDIAVLWVHPQAFPDAVPAPLAHPQRERATVVGEKIFTIGSPLSQRKILTTGIVSGVEQRAIIGDISINPGNSGGPLFDSRGIVIGLTTFREQVSIGPGIAGIVRIEESYPLLQRAVAKRASLEPPSRAPLLVEPTDRFPLEALREAINRSGYDTDPYFFSRGKFDVAVLTPPLVFYLSEAGARQAVQQQAKRTGKSGEAATSFPSPLGELRGWQEYLGHYQPVITIRARPQLRETFWSSFARGMAQGATPAKFRFRTDFYRMRLLCGQNEVLPIHPGKVAHIINESNRFVNAVDATYEGIYTYPADAISSDCSSVRLELYSEKEPDKPSVKELSADTVRRIAADFEPYRRAWKPRE